METRLLPVARPFHVWFVPGDRTPRRIGKQLAEYDDAVALAEIAATDLPLYGYPGGQVLVMWGTSVLKTLPTAHTPPGASAVHMEPSLHAHTDLRREIARLVLEDLRHLSGDAEPTLAAPPDWIERLELALRVVASPADQRRYRLDGLHCVTMDYLHRRVAAVLRQFDRLVLAGIPLPTPLGDETRLAL